MSDSTQERVAHLLSSYPLILDLRKSDPDIPLEHTFLRIAEKNYADNFTIGTIGLGGTDPDEASAPVVLVSQTSHTVIAVVHIGRQLTGHVGFAHGGAIATIFDECCGRVCLTADQPVAQTNGLPNGTHEAKPKIPAVVTASLSIKYIAPVPIDSLVVVRAVVDESQGRKVTAKASLWTVKDGQTEGTLAAEATGVFIEPKV